jgi:hypothetical protein
MRCTPSQCANDQLDRTRSTEAQDLANPPTHAPAPLQVPAEHVGRQACSRTSQLSTGPHWAHCVPGALPAGHATGQAMWSLSLGTQMHRLAQFRAGSSLESRLRQHVCQRRIHAVGAARLLARAELRLGIFGIPPRARFDGRRSVGGAPYEPRSPAQRARVGPGCTVNSGRLRSCTRPRERTARVRRLRGHWIARFVQ